MTRQIYKLPWDDDCAAAARQFSFGDHYWEQEIEQWIKDEVDEAIARFKADVWLYATEDDGPVGYGSLGPSRWNWPLPDDPRVPISIIPAVGIDKRFRSEPSGPGERRFSDQIFDDLIYEAAAHEERHPLLGLFVHPEHIPAMKVYERAGFTFFSKTYINADGIEYRSMLLELKGSPRQAT